MLSHLANDDGSPLPPIRIEAGAHGPAVDLRREDLRRLACATGAFFRRIAVAPGDRVVTFLPTGRPLLQSIFGAWAAGAVISVLAPAVDGGRSTLSIDVVRSMLNVAKPRVVVLAEADRSALSSLVLEIGARAVFVEELPTEGSDDEPHASRPDDAALIQFTSGSTGVPKGAVISHGQLIENVRLMAERIDFRPVDRFVSWLPLHHDFGFVAELAMPVTLKADVVIIPNEVFARHPLVWPRALSDHRATHTAVPPSAAALLCRPIFTSRCRDLDLSALRGVWFGAEPISLATCLSFEKVFAEQGLKPGVVLPAYGMAEATLGISVSPPGAPRRIAHLDRDEFHHRGLVRFVAPNGVGSLPLLSNGRPLPGVRVRILDDDDRELPEGRQGRIVVSSSMVTRRYFGSDEDPQPGGWFVTGDLGFLLDGEVYVTGRSKDVIIRNGVNMPAHLIEEAVLRCFPDRIGRAVAFSVPSERDLRDEVVVAVEPRRADADQGFATTVRAAVLHELNFAIDRVEVLPKGSIPRTTSGKLQRAKARDLHRRGELALGFGEVVS